MSDSLTPRTYSLARTGARGRWRMRNPGVVSLARRLIRLRSWSQGRRPGRLVPVAVAPRSDIDLADLGPTTRAAHDRLLREFKRQGWRDDDDAAEAIVRTLTRRGG